MLSRMPRKNKEIRENNIKKQKNKRKFDKNTKMQLNDKEMKQNNLDDKHTK